MLQCGRRSKTSTNEPLPRGRSRQLGNGIRVSARCCTRQLQDVRTPWNLARGLANTWNPASQRTARTQCRSRQNRGALCGRSIAVRRRPRQRHSNGTPEHVRRLSGPFARHGLSPFFPPSLYLGWRKTPLSRTHASSSKRRSEDRRRSESLDVLWKLASHRGGIRNVWGRHPRLG